MTKCLNKTAYGKRIRFVNFGKETTTHGYENNVPSLKIFAASSR